MNSSNNDLVACPFNKAHQVSRYRMPGHILKCAKNYSGVKLQCCPFNSTHMIASTDDIKDHYKECADYNANYLPELEQVVESKPAA